MTPASAPVYDPRRPEILADPFAAYARLRREDPVHWSAALKGWVLTRYDDVRAVLADVERFSSDRITPFADHLERARRERVRDLLALLGRWAVFVDPPRHTRLRALMNRAFTSRAVESLRPRVQGVVDHLVAAVAPRGEMDLVRDFAYPLPASVIAHVLGVPLADLDRFKAWSDDLAAFVGSAQGTPDKLERAQRGIAALAAYFRDLVAARRAAPADDLLSALVAAGERGETLGEEELVANSILLLFAGHETTTNLIGNGMYWLLRHPAEHARLVAEPALAASAVEEMLRYDGPSGAQVRVTTADVVLGGRTLARGDRVFLMLNAANRDPAQFPEPDRFDVARQPNRHLTFGHGIHFCLGAPLARLEGQIAVETLARRLRGLRPADERGDWNDSLVLRGLRALPVRFTPAAA